MFCVVENALRPQLDGCDHLFRVLVHWDDGVTGEELTEQSETDLLTTSRFTLTAALNLERGAYF